MSVYRRGAGADAMMVLELDGLLDEDMLAEVRAVEGIQSAIFLRRRAC